MVHNNWINTTTGLSPNQILFRYNPTLNSNKVLQTHNALVESRIQTMTKNRADAIQALNKVANQKGPPPSQFHLREQVWLDASHLKLPHQKAKLTPKCLGPFKITQEISPVAYQLELPPNWRIHDVFHTSLLTPYHETAAHGPNFTRPPPDLIDGEEEYEVERSSHTDNSDDQNDSNTLSNGKDIPKVTTHGNQLIKSMPLKLSSIINPQYNISHLQPDISQP